MESCFDPGYRQVPRMTDLSGFLTDSNFDKYAQVAR
ncbi:hypothetical protein TBK1r_50380 [Stieleria magnilauensis]|uniref:Uncharacterized protein n=1 Tax=Stieleria magnilauensis TaxID=2527963 RepID=A0ABX5XW69_9BACT|nr:hypothetical protein TBK1r_50380 [Planctomycetes bacterium TBK1r]